MTERAVWARGWIKLERRNAVTEANIAAIKKKKSCIDDLGGKRVRLVRVESTHTY
jgi:hypothetical protein